MPWWIPIAVAGMACLGVLTVVASTAAGRYEGQHVLTDPQEEWDAYMAEGRSYGSMSLDDEQALYPEERGHPGQHLVWRGGGFVWADLLPAPTVDPEPWLAQMTAELSPEALDDDEPLSPPPPSHPVWRNPRLDDPGPGDAAVEPPASSGPDQPSRWLAEQLEVLRAWAERQQAYAEILA